MKNATTVTDIEVGEVKDGPFLRVGLQLSESNFAGIDILRNDGTLLCKLNIFEFDNGGDVDVILADDQVGRLVLLENGVRLPVPNTENTKVFAVDIKPR